MIYSCYDAWQSNERIHSKSLEEVSRNFFELPQHLSFFQPDTCHFFTSLEPLKIKLSVRNSGQAGLSLNSDKKKGANYYISLGSQGGLDLVYLSLPPQTLRDSLPSLPFLGRPFWTAIFPPSLSPPPGDSPRDLAREGRSESSDLKKHETFH